MYVQGCNRGSRPTRGRFHLRLVRNVWATRHAGRSATFLSTAQTLARPSDGPTRPQSFHSVVTKRSSARARFSCRYNHYGTQRCLSSRNTAPWRLAALAPALAAPTPPPKRRARRDSSGTGGALFAVKRPARRAAGAERADKRLCTRAIIPAGGKSWRGQVHGHPANARAFFCSATVRDGAGNVKHPGAQVGVAPAASYAGQKLSIYSLGSRFDGVTNPKRRRTPTARKRRARGGRRRLVQPSDGEATRARAWGQ